MRVNFEDNLLIYFQRVLCAYTLYVNNWVILAIFYIIKYNTIYQKSRNYSLLTRVTRLNYL